MYVVGLTGGIGSGKSTFAALLAEHGAQVIDADQIGRDALRPGEPAWSAVVETFGDEILAAGSLDVDRKRLADVVFNDRDALTALNQITHPVIVQAIADRLDALSATDAIVVLDAALIVEMGLASSLDALVVVTAPEELRRERLVRGRGMSAGDVAARIAAQAPEEELVAQAHIVVRNHLGTDHLAAEAARVMQELRERAMRK